jgi:hypothetical protein
MPSFRTKLTPAQRNYEPTAGIDAGFLNYRRLYPFVPPTIRQEIEQRIASLPQHIDSHYRELSKDYEFISAVLYIAQERGARTVQDLLASGRCGAGDVVSSTDDIIGSRDVYEKDRVTLRIDTECDFEKSAWLRLSTANIKADTARLELSRRSRLSFVGIVEEIADNNLFVAPLVLGAPWLHRGATDPPGFDMMFTHYEFFENFVEDIDEFSVVQDLPRAEASEDWQVLRDVPERGIKAAICRILGDKPVNDWGGEQSDHFSTSIHLSGRRVSAAFLLKGPSDFTEMKARHLGKNGDQIYRLAQEPAELLVLQHSHLVSPPVRATLRAFAVNPASPRRYLVLDGPDTYRLLVSHRLLDFAKQKT